MRRLLHLLLILPLIAFSVVTQSRAQDATSSALQLLLMGKGLHVNDWGTQTSNNLLKLEAAIAGRTDITLGSLDYTLSDTEARSAYIVIAGTLSNDVRVIVPPRAHSWMVYNNATAHNVILKLAATGTSVTLTPASRGYLVWTDGVTGVYPLTDPAGIATAQAVANAAQATANAALPKAGGVMTGALNMNTSPLYGVPSPVNADWAANKGYVDAAVSTGVGSIQAIPSGLVAGFYSSTCPSGWILANGVNSPDMRGVFMRGRDFGRGQNPDGDQGAGTYQVDALQDHTHGLNAAMQAGNGFGFSGSFGYSGAYYNATNNMVSGNVASETRPRNVTLVMCMKP